jgi:sugar O-acyltransferase (sialic acid O-acetyltransferase NeuD family)
MVSKLILIGGGGHCHACIDVIESTRKFDIIGVVDTIDKIGQMVLDYKVIGTDEDLPKLVNKDTWFLITLGHIKTSAMRRKIFKNLESLDANIATVISNNALVSKYSSIAKGTIIMHRATVGVGSKIGQNCIINTNANIEHDTTVGDDVHVSTHAVVNGNCELKNGVFVGSNATIFQGISIENDTLIGAGSLVTKNITEKGIYYGNPLFKKNV